MYKLTIHLLWIILVSSSYSFSQTNNEVGRPKKNKQAIGFYGNRFFIQLGGGIHHNSILKLANNGERTLRKNSYYSTYRSAIKSDQFNYSLYGNLGFVLSKKNSFSLDFNYYFGNTVLIGYGYSNDPITGDDPGFDARVSYNTIRIMPRFEMSDGSSNAPIGFVHSIGAGIELSKARSGNYLVAVSGNNSFYNIPSATYERSIQFTDQLSYNLCFQYGIEYRIPISKNIAVNFGGYMHLNIPLTGKPKTYNNYSTYYGQTYVLTSSEDVIRSKIARARLTNLFSLRTGLVIML